MERKLADQEASCMTEASAAQQKADVAEVIGFLRRFADLMANGYNARYLHRASDLLESLAAGAAAASDQDILWRSRFETLTRHSESLERECVALKADIEGHLDITSSVLAERDALGLKLQASEAELSELRQVLSREREERAAKSVSHEQTLIGLRGAFDQKLVALQVSVQSAAEECEQLRRDLERQRVDAAAKLSASEAETYRLRVAADRERIALQAELRARGDELSVFQMASKREIDALKEKVSTLEAGRASLRAAFDRVSFLSNQAAADRDAAGTSMIGANVSGWPLQNNRAQSGGAEGNAIVPKATLRQVRAQFEYLAREFVPRGEIASQVMCELGAYTMDMALLGGREDNHLSVGEVARSILAPLPGDQG